MNTFTITRLINADIDTVWEQIADVTLIENWHPGVKSADSLSKNTKGIGATRRCNFYNGTDVVEEVVELDDNYKFKLEIREFKAPMKKFDSIWQLKPTASGATQVIVTMEYDMKFSIFGQLLDLLIVRSKMPKLLAKVLAGLEYHLSSGELVDESFSIPVQTVAA